MIKAIKMKSIKKIKRILREHKEELKENFGIKKIGIFGSYVKNEQRPRSDIDILVEFKEPIGFFKFMDLEEYLGILFKKKVDLVSKKALKPLIGKHILKEVIYV